jgi:hypothetical protein
MAACLGVFALTQLLFFPEEKNVACVFIVIGGCLVTALLTARESHFQRWPISTFVVMWFPFSNLLIPLLGTTTDWHPLIYKLKMPLEAFGYTALVAVTIALAHLVYRHLSFLGGLRGSVQEMGLRKLGLFTPPSILQLWFFGGIGSLAAVLLFFVFDGANSADVGFLPQLVHAIRPFSYAPFLIPLVSLFGSQQRPSRIQYVLVVIYVGFTLGMAMVANARAVFAVPMLTFLLAVFFAFLTGRLSLKMLSFRVVAVGVVFVLLAVVVLPDLATAMRVVRAKRGNVGPMELATATIETFFDKKALRNYWAINRAMAGSAGSWDEDYLQNEFLQRFSLIKFTDLSLYFSRSFGDADRTKLRGFSDARLISSLPNPVIRFLGLPVRKTSVMSMSFGDFLYGARSLQYSAFRTASFVVVDRLVHGMLFYPILMAVSLLLFFTVDCFTRSVLVRRPDRSPPMSVIIFSPVAILFMFTFVQTLFQEALATTLMFYARGLPQILLLYWIFFHGSRLLNSFAPHFGERPRIAARRVASAGSSRSPNLV